MELKKGMYVRHPSNLIHQNELGIGLVVEDQINETAVVFFELKLKIITVSTKNINFMVVQDPGDAQILLNNALLNPGKDREPFPCVLNTFLKRFSGGLHGAVYLRGERNYKADASALAMSYFSKDVFEEKIVNQDWVLLATQLKKIFSINLLSKYERIKLADALNDEKNHKDICQCFYMLLHHEKKLSSRIDLAAKKLEKFELDKWPIVSYLLFAVFPDKYMFVKPTMTKEAAENRGFDIQYSSQVNGNTYEKVLLLSQDLFKRLQNDERNQLHPRDMIDVQGFMWCTFANGWTNDEILEFEQKISLVEMEE